MSYQSKQFGVLNQRLRDLEETATAQVATNTRLQQRVDESTTQQVRVGAVDMGRLCT